MCWSRPAYNQSTKQETEVPLCSNAVVPRSWSWRTPVPASRSESSVASHLGPKRKRPRHLALVCEGSAGWHDGAGEMGRRPEHSFYPGSGYCGRRCHHLHIHFLVPGGGIAPDGQSWIAGRPGFFLPVTVLSRLFRGLFLHDLQRAFTAGELNFFSSHRYLHEPAAFRRYLAPTWDTDWVVYAKRPFAGSAQVLDYVGRYTHRVAISNNRLVSLAGGKVSFRWKDYRDGNRQKTMTLDGGEFIRRFLIHVLPDGFHRIRYYGFLGNCHRTRKLARCRELD